MPRKEDEEQNKISKAPRAPWIAGPGNLYFASVTRSHFWTPTRVRRMPTKGEKKRMPTEGWTLRESFTYNQKCINMCILSRSDRDLRCYSHIQNVFNWHPKCVWLTSSKNWDATHVTPKIPKMCFLDIDPLVCRGIAPAGLFQLGVCSATRHILANIAEEEGLLVIFLRQWSTYMQGLTRLRNHVAAEKRAKFAAQKRQPAITRAACPQQPFFGWFNADNENFEMLLTSSKTST